MGTSPMEVAVAQSEHEELYLFHFAMNALYNVPHLHPVLGMLLENIEDMMMVRL
jgi:hypothetical protein